MNKPPASLPELAESVLDDAVESVRQDIEYILDAFMPDGRPFGTEKLSEEDQLAKYVGDGLHDNPDAAMNWIREHVLKLVDMMKAFGIDDQQIMSVHPYDIVETAGLIWSGHMENLLREHQTRIAPAVMAPPVPLNSDLGIVENGLSA